MTQQDHHLGLGWSDVARRAIFLACSWTWCIGMWFPVYMARDFGWPGWVAFLVPNALGAAAVGAVLRERSSTAITQGHAPAVRTFSLVTLAFHCSWLTWLLSDMVSHSLIRQGWVGGVIAFFSVAGGFALGRVRSLGRWGWLAVLAYAASLAAWLFATRTGITLRLPPTTGEQPVSSLAFVIPALVLGFGLCPYLDATFHRVRIETPGRKGVAAFGLGFGLFFPVLMVFTLLYAGGLIAGRWSYYLWLHFIVQAAFTIGAHVRELGPGGIVSWGDAWPRRRLLVGAALLLPMASAALPWLPSPIEGRSASRLVYELFMSMYGLVFPAYVWIVMIERSTPMRARLTAWAAACVLGAPCFWLGYIEQRYVWLAPGVGLVLAAPLLLSLSRRGGPRAGAA